MMFRNTLRRGLTFTLLGLALATPSPRQPMRFP
jgi:hypothetical protein